MPNRTSGTLSRPPSQPITEASSSELDPNREANVSARRRSAGRSPALDGLQPLANHAAPRMTRAQAAVATAIVDGELQLATYLLARSLDGRPVPLIDVIRLRKANATVNETRELLKYGRGNVDVDVRATGNESRWRMKAARTLKEELDSRSGEGWVDYSTQAVHSAAAAIVFGAGNCGEHASLAGVYHTRRLEKREAVHHVHDRFAGHSWAEARLPAPPESDDGARAVVMDAWADGPPVLAPDGRFARRRERAESMLHFEASTGRDARIAANDLVLKTRANGSAEVQRRIQTGVTLSARYAAWVDSKLPSGIGDWSAQKVVDDAFAKRVLEKLIGAPSSADVLEHAARVADQFGIDPAHRAKQAQRIFEAARALLMDR